MGGSNPKVYGTRKEREYIKLLLAEGYDEVIRAGGSRSHHAKDKKGDIDLVARGKDKDHTLWAQVKAGTKEYIARCCREWLRPPLPPYHVARLACFVKEDRKWYDYDGETWREH